MLSTFFTYDEDSPTCLINAVTRNSKALKGSKAGSLNSSGYYYIRHNGEFI